MSEVFPTVFLTADAVQTNSARLMGRQSAGSGFLRGLARCFAADPRPLTLVHAGGSQQAVLEQEVRRCGWKGSIQHRSIRVPDSWRDSPVLYYPAPLDTRIAWQRSRSGSTSLALCGVTHTICSSAVQGQIADYVSGPFAPWDALICTSRSVRTAVDRLWDQARSQLAHRLGLPRVQPSMPLAPVIPLGIHTQDFEASADLRSRTRQQWQVAPDEVVVLFVGRLSLHAKANPLPMYLAVAAAAARSGRTMRVVECGWFASDAIRQAFDQAARLAGITVTRVDGREPEMTRKAYAAADIFMSLSDNIQETFGLTPVEAMAAGLPVIVSDWDGYRETVRHGQDGFLIPTLQPGDPRCAQAISEGYEDNRLTYDLYIAHAHLMASVDIPAAVAALVTLAGQPELRRAMGESGRARARMVFDWRVVMGQYKALWSEQASLRDAALRAQGSGPVVSVRNPAFANPLQVFSHYPSLALGPDHRITCVPGAQERVQDLRALSMWSFAQGQLVSAQDLARALGHLPIAPQEGLTVHDWCERMQWTVSQGLRQCAWLHKVGLVQASGLVDPAA